MILFFTNSKAKEIEVKRCQQTWWESLEKKLAELKLTFQKISSSLLSKFLKIIQMKVTKIK